MAVRPLSRKSAGVIANSGGIMTFLNMHWELFEDAQGHRSLRMKWEMGGAGDKSALPSTNWNPFTGRKVA